MASIIIDGVEYPAPNPAALTMGQARIIKRYTGLTLEQLDSADTTDPDLIAAFCHLVLLEANPRGSFAQIEAEVDKIELAKLEFAADGEAAELPPAGAQNGTGDARNVSPPPSGPTSDGNSAGTPETNPPPIGTPV